MNENVLHSTPIVWSKHASVQGFIFKEVLFKEAIRFLKGNK